MKRCLAVLFVIALCFLGGARPAQAQTALDDGRDSGFKLTSGALLCTDLPRSLDARKLKRGDDIVARVTQDLLSGRRVIVPREAKVIGRVAELKLPARKDHETRLLLVFEKVITKAGKEIQFQYPAFVKALAPDQQVAIASTNLNDLPIKAELGKAIDRVSNMPVLMGDSNSPTYGLIMPFATGVFGLPGLKLEDTPRGVYIVAPKGNIKLEYGAQMVLSVATPINGVAQKPAEAHQ
jgi:hypothetical protein